MKIYKKLVLQMTDTIGEYVRVYEDSYDHDGPVMLCDRAAQKSAKQAAATAASRASTLGQEAQGELKPLEQFDIQNLTNPQGFGQRGVMEMLTAAEAGTGGGAGDLVTQTERGAAARHNLGGGSSAMEDEISRNRLKALASTSEGIAGQDVQLKEKQREGAAADLGNLYGINTKGMLDSMDIQNKNINTQVEAGKSGWFQNLMQGIAVVTGAGKAAFGKPGGAGFAT
jgi:hypothetical protein